MDKEELAKRLVGHVYNDDDDGVNIGRGDDARNMRDGWGVGDGGWGNPFVMESVAEEAHRQRDSITIVGSREESVERFKQLLVERALHDDAFRKRLVSLAGKRLDCWCQTRGDTGPACHGEVLALHAMYFANNEPSE
jgi:hypothetical protein